MVKPAIVEDHKIVVQHNHIINGKFDLTSTELRIFLYMLSQIKPSTKNQIGDTEFKLCQVPVSFISESVGGANYRLLREFQTTLIKKSFMLEELAGKGKRRFKSYNIFSEVSYLEGANCLEVKFNSGIKDFLLNIKGNFTKSELKHLLELRNVHSFRIYWLLKQHVDFGERTIDYDELKAMLFLTDKYTEFNNFKNKVLEVAKADLADTDMSFEYDKIRVGKAIGKIRFVLTKDKGELAEAKRAKKPHVVQGNLFNQPQKTLKYKPTVMPKQKLKATSKLSLLELHGMHKDNYEESIAARLAGGWYWNDDETILYHD